MRPGTAVLCRTAMAVLLARLFDFTLRTLESYFSRYWSGQLQATPIKACSARFQGSCAENLGQVPSACPASPAGAIDAPDWTWESLVELGGREASGILIALLPDSLAAWAAGTGGRSGTLPIAETIAGTIVGNVQHRRGNIAGDPGS